MYVHHLGVSLRHLNLFGDVSPHFNPHGRHHHPCTGKAGTSSDFAAWLWPRVSKCSCLDLSSLQPLQHYRVPQAQGQHTSSAWTTPRPSMPPQHLGWGWQLAGYTAEACQLWRVLSAYTTQGCCSRPDRIWVGTSVYFAGTIGSILASGQAYLLV